MTNELNNVNKIEEEQIIKDILSLKNRILNTYIMSEEEKQEGGEK